MAYSSVVLRFILAWLALAIGTTSAQYLRGTSVEINNGVRTAWWSPKVGASSTSISTMHPAPTLWYNCRYAKSICNNVEKTQPGANAGTLQMELVYDSDTKRRDTRRSGGEGQPGMCPGTWKNTHTCPEPDQPDVWVIDMQRDRQLRPVKIPNSLKYPSGMYNGKANTQIADFARRPSGLMYTCDEFPFASTIQGGTGFIGDANAGLGYASTTYCAPQRSACGRNEEWMNRWRLDNSGLAAQFDKLVKKTSRSTAKRQFRRTGLLRDPESDQDAQGHALSLLTKAFPPTPGLYAYQLRTADSDENYSARYIVVGTNDKRDVPVQHIHEIFLNGTSSHRRLPATPEQLQSYYSKRDGFNNTQSSSNTTTGDHLSLTQVSTATESVGSQSTLIQSTTAGGNATSQISKLPSGMPTLEGSSTLMLTSSSTLSISNTTVISFETTSSQNSTATLTSQSSEETRSNTTTSSGQNSTSSTAAFSFATTLITTTTSSSSQRNETMSSTASLSSSVETSSASTLASASASISTSSSVNGTVITASDIWDTTSPVITCTSMPCIVILPPSTLPTLTTFIPEPITTDGQTTTFPPITTDRIEWSKVTITDPSQTIHPIESFDIPDPIGIGINPPTLDLPDFPPIGIVTTPPPSSPTSDPTSTPPETSATNTESADTTTEPSTASKTTASNMGTVSTTPVPLDDDGTDGTSEDEDDEDDEEDEDPDECFVPGFFTSDFPIGGSSDDDSSSSSIESSNSEASAASTASETTTAAVASTTAASQTTQASKTTSMSYGVGTASCYAAPTATETDGPLEVSLTFAQQAITDFCDQMQSEGKVFAPGSDNSSGDLYFPGDQTAGIRTGNPVYLSAAWNSTNGDQDCPTLDFSESSALETCNMELGAISASCLDGDITWGGIMLYNCIQWELQTADIYSKEEAQG